MAGPSTSSKLPTEDSEIVKFEHANGQHGNGKAVLPGHSTTLEEETMMGEVSFGTSV